MSKKLAGVLLSLIFGFVAGGLSPLAAAESKNVLKLYNEAVELQNEENWYTASQYFIEVVNSNPAFSDAWFRLADCSYHLGEFDLAFQYLESAEKYEKDRSEIKNLKGMILLALGRTDEARQIFNEVLKKYPNDIDAHFGLAEIELYDGKFSGAENQYAEALKRQNTNRKALLSLALVCAETKRYTQSEKYLRQAMQYYSGEPEVHYLAAIIYTMKGDYKSAEKHARIAVEIRGGYEQAYELLAQIVYLQHRYSEVIDLCDFIISRNRNASSAWYLKGTAQAKLGNAEDAISTWDTGLNINPQDELMRMMLELTAKNELDFDDARRKQWASYHLNNARQYDSRYDKAGSTYEYQRALMLDPSNTAARLAYADILELNGMHELYLDQLKFVKENSESGISTSLSDTIEAYDSLLNNTLAKRWKVDAFYLDKIRWNIAVFYTENTSTFNHADSDRLTALACGDVFSGVAITSVKTQVTPVSGYGEAFKNARANNFDYFIMVSLSEGEDDVSLSATMYSGRTGTETFNEKYYATGNNRFSTVLRRFRNSVLEKLTVRGKILQRNGKTVLIDLGRSENIIKDAEFKIVRKGGVKTADAGSGLFFRDDDVVGMLVVTEAGEEVSEAVITSHGFYDRINENDELVLVSMPAQNTEAGMDTVPNADEEGNPVVNNSVKGEELVAEIKKAVERPAIIDLLRKIR
ncbi:Tfp pilus assembly protein PilF [Treponema bryantii]|uniref:Tfp pilus assembly protein PilF n=1 Tax=Treponema bryantii TaxID=163 RepID=A0A1I3K3H2_9SPIR|nr:tetratricopeptide repeat protein [Treponema bryantii]SFI67061.1 Tfp pilus assembly protein PilF [Treponema bryantii]